MNILFNNKDIFIKKIEILLIVLTIILGGAFFGIPNMVKADGLTPNTNSFEEFTKNIYNGQTSIVLGNDITFDEAVALPAGNYSIELNGHNLRCSSSTEGVDGSTGAMIKITEKDVNLTITNNGAEAGFINDGKDGSRAIHVDVRSSANNQISIENTIFEGFNVAGLNGPSITAKQGGAIYYRTSIEYAENTSKLTINNCKFSNNEATEGGAIYFTSSSTSKKIEINNTIFENNKAYCTVAGMWGNGNGKGGALYFDYGLDVTLKDNTFNSNETILKADDSSADTYHIFNSYGSGGAIYNNRNGLDLIGNKFTNNKSLKDGGAIYYELTTNASKPLTISNSSSNKALFDNNSAKRGGAIMIYESNNALSHAIEIKEGTFSNNSASEDGGAINYTQGDNGYLKLKNTLITGNTAVSGGGIWLCPTAQGKIHSTVSGAIYGNTATGSWENNGKTITARGNDIRYSTEDEDDELPNVSGNETHDVTISSRSNDGHIVNWFADEVNKRFAQGDTPVDMSLYQNRKDPFSLARVDGDSSKYDVTFTGNTAGKRGGAIATNYTLEIGEDVDVDVKVEKKFSKNDEEYTDTKLLPKSVFVNLYRQDQDGKNETLLDSHVELNKENKWSHTFEDLPKYPADNENTNYKYVVREEDESNLKSTDVKCDDMVNYTGNCTFTLTNEVQPLPVKYSLEVEKKIDSFIKPTEKEEFTFELKTEDKDGIVLPENRYIKIKGEGKAKFDEMTFTKEGTYKVSVNELKGNNNEYTYDESIYEVSITVKEKNDSLTIDSVNITKNNKKVDDVIFNNQYEPTKTKITPIERIVIPPNTSDRISTWIMLLWLSIVGIYFALKYERELEKEGK